VLKPKIEPLPAEAWQASLDAIREADVVIVIGTSLEVAPVNRLPFLTKARRIFINAEETGLEDRFDVFVKGRARDSLMAIAERLANHRVAASNTAARSPFREARIPTAIADRARCPFFVGRHEKRTVDACAAVI
jgi:thiamine pyrophosphate-dependent acetolactate synthase large subunit-like protein